MSAARSCALILIATLAAFFIRAPSLDRRPMHVDEAVQGFKFGELLQGAPYHYDRHEYHGPTLNYLTLIPAGIFGIDRFTATTEWLLRGVPVFFGTLLVFLVLWFGVGLGRIPAIIAAFLTALSPAFVFYSRYYIHEMLLVVFTFGVLIFGYRFLRFRSLPAALMLGLFTGLMVATKETWIIAAGSIVGAWVLTVMVGKKRPFGVKEFFKPTLSWKFVVSAGVAMVTAVSLFSSFFQNPKGILDSILTYEVYFNRADGVQIHEHPWNYYLSLLSFYQFDKGPVFTEGLILALAAFGFGVGLSGRSVGDSDPRVVRFLALYTGAMVLIYSVIPYKTPWCMLGFLHGMILLAGVGATLVGAWLTRIHPWLCRLLFLLGFGHLAWQSYVVAFQIDSDSRNPYVYAHTGKDIFTMEKRVRDMAELIERSSDPVLQVICRGGDYWPLPWYLRDLNVEYLSEVDMDGKTAPMILLQPNLEADLLKRLFEVPPPGHRDMHLPLFYEEGEVEDLELRPGVPILGYVRKSLWDDREASLLQTVDEFLDLESTPEPDSESER